MKVISGVIVLALAVAVISCGGNANKENEKDASAEQVVVSNRVAAGTFTNEQLGYSISYPKDILLPQDASANGEEQIFKGAGKAELRIYSDKRVDKSGTPLSFNTAYEEDIADKKGRQIAHSALSPNYYVISGLDGDMLYYQKTIFTKAALVTAVLKYPKEEKDTYNAMIAPIFNSFK